jgi:neutral trehalase
VQAVVGFPPVEGLVASPDAFPPLDKGYKTEAQRIAQKNLATATTLFEQTGKLWEKTDAERGAVAAGEYDAPAMMGWSAGVYVACANYLAL